MHITFHLLIIILYSILKTVHGHTSIMYHLEGQLSHGYIPHNMYHISVGCQVV